MPMVNGLELARQLKSETPIRIIMLTGEADQNVAVQALNRKEIDCFIVKSAENYIPQLLHFITELQRSYFVDLSRGILQSLNSEGGHPLQDSDFIKLFEKLCRDRHIIEAYLLDESGSFLMLDAHGQMTWLIVRREMDMQTFQELAENEPDISSELLASLKNREKIVRFPSLDNPYAPIHKWLFEKASRINHKSIYYSVLQGAHVYGLKERKIKPYLRFLQSK